MTSSERWERVAGAEQIATNAPLGAALGDQELVLIKSTAGVRAFEGRCPHQGTLLAEGEIQGSELVCRAHGWRFDCATGERRGASNKPSLKSFPCRVEGGAI